MIDSTGTGPYAIMGTCKYLLPCGYCELKKKICKVDNPMTVTPIIDAVSVVRCKNCKHYHTHDHRCTVWNHGVKQADFCSCGERREE